MPAAKKNTKQALNLGGSWIGIVALNPTKLKLRYWVWMLSILIPCIIYVVISPYMPNFWSSQFDKTGAILSAVIGLPITFATSLALLYLGVASLGSANASVEATKAASRIDMSAMLRDEIVQINGSYVGIARSLARIHRLVKSSDEAISMTHGLHLGGPENAYIIGQENLKILQINIVVEYDIVLGLLARLLEKPLERNELGARLISAKHSSCFREETRGLGYNLSLEVLEEISEFKSATPYEDFSKEVLRFTTTPEEYMGFDHDHRLGGAGIVPGGLGLIAGLAFHANDYESTERDDNGELISEYLIPGAGILCDLARIVPTSDEVLKFVCHGLEENDTHKLMLDAAARHHDVRTPGVKEALIEFQKIPDALTLTRES